MSPRVDVTEESMEKLDVRGEKQVFVVTDLRGHRRVYCAASIRDLREQPCVLLQGVSLPHVSLCPSRATTRYGNGTMMRSNGMIRVDDADELGHLFHDASQPYRIHCVALERGRMNCSACGAEQYRPCKVVYSKMY